MEGLEGLTEAVVDELEEFLWLIAIGNILLCWRMRMSAFETMMMAKKSGKIKTFVEEGLDGLTEVANLDATILRVDPALAVVGGCSKDEEEAQPTRPKRKLYQCSYCVRSFGEEEKLVQHIDAEHFME